MVIFLDITMYFHYNFRPKRERKLPAHLKAGDFEYSYKGPNDSAAAKKKASNKEPLENKQDESIPDDIPDELLEESSPKSEDEEEEDGQDDDDYNSEAADSEDDPNKLWCICQQPHNNRFMICCDSCLDWYHGKCVGITKKMGKEMEEADHQWTCPKCKTKEEKQNTAQLKDKLKERQTKVITKENITAAGNNDKNTTSKPQKPNKSMRRSLSKDKETNEPKKVKFLNKKGCFDFFGINDHFNKIISPGKNLLLRSCLLLQRLPIHLFFCISNYYACNTLCQSMLFDDKLQEFHEKSNKNAFKFKTHWFNSKKERR